jgi:hypothetical protein
MSFAIDSSIAAATKNKRGISGCGLKESRIRFKAVLAVFQCSSAPAGSIPPFNSPQAK